MKKWITITLLLSLTLMLFSQRRNLKPAKTLWKQGLTYYQRHSYKKALNNMDQLLKHYPRSKYRLEAKIIKGKSHIGLRQYSKGTLYLDKLIKKNPKLKRRADLMESMGQAYQNWSVYSYANQSVSYYKKAVSLYLLRKGKSRKKVINIYYKMIKIYQYKSYYKEHPKDYKKQYAARDRDVTRTYNAIVKIARDQDTKATALYKKAGYIRSYFYYNPKKQELTIKAYKTVIKKYPRHELAAQSQYQVASLYNQYGDYVTAIKEFNRFIRMYQDHKLLKSAKYTLNSIKAPLISLKAFGTTKPGEFTKLTWSIRNVKNVQLKAYKVKLFDVFKDIERLNEINNYSLKGFQTAKRWFFKTPDRGIHKFHYSNSYTNRKLNPYIQVPIKKNGAYIIKAFGKNPEGKGYEVTTLIMVSNLGLIVKSGKDKTLFYTVNSLSGKPVEEAQILSQELIKSTYSSIFKKYSYDYAYRNFRSGQNGLVFQDWKTASKKKGYYWHRNLLILAKSGDNYAISGSNYYYYWYGYRRNYKIYGYTDRPVYRPFQKVHFKQIIRKYERGKYVNYTKGKVHVLITDPKGNKLFDKTLSTNEYGSVSDSFQLGEKATLGVYHIQVKVKNENYGYWASRGNNFRVEEYKKPEYKVAVTTEKSTYKIGDKITFKIQGKYYFGSPVANANVEYTIYKTQFYHTYRPYRRYSWFYDERFYNRWASRGFGHYYPYYYHRRELVKRGKLKLDKKGNLFVNVKSKHFEKARHADIKYTVEAKVVDQSRREIKGYGEVKVTNKAFYIYLNPERYLYEKNETAKIKVTAKNPNGQPVSFKGVIKVYPVKYIYKKINKRNVQVEKLGKAILTGKVFVGMRGETVFKFKPDREGYFKAIVTTKDSRGAVITGSSYLWIAEKKNEFDHYRYKDIEIIVDKDTYVMGDTARILINTKHKNSYVLLTAEADDIYYKKVIYVKGKSKLVKLPITENLSPNIWLTASTFRANKLYRDSLEVIVPPEHKYLKVKVIAPKPTFKPQEKAEFTVICKDYKGNGVETELSIGFVDSSIYYIQSPFRADIRKFFYGQKRYLQVKTSTGYDYLHYGRGKLTANSKDKSSPQSSRGGNDEEEDNVRDGSRADLKRSSKRKRQAFKGKNKDSFGGQKNIDYKKARVRKDFPDTMFWKAHVKTDKNGVARIKVKFPDTLTTWKVKSTAITKTTDVGVYDLDIITRKNLIVRLQAPRFFQEKDLVYVSGIVHNYLSKDKTALVKLNVTSQLGISRVITKGSSSKNISPLRQEFKKEVRVPKNGEKRVDFVIKVRTKQKTPVGQKDMATVTISALTDEESDAMQLKFPVLEYGVEKFLAQNGLLNTEKRKTVAKLSYNIPRQIKPGSQEIKVILNPSIASVMIDSLPYLISYPYGCVEQTMSRFLPTVITRNTLDKLGVSLEDLAEKHQNEFAYLKKSPIYKSSELNKMVDLGLKRLYNFQHGDGGWGWWQNGRSNSYMTAYVVYGLAAADKANVKINQIVIDKGVQFVIKKLTSTEKISRYSWYRDDDNVRAYMLYSISTAKPDAYRNKNLKKVLKKIWAKRDDLNEYSKVLLALTQSNIGDSNKAKIMLENLEDFIKVNKELKTANFQDINRYWYWYENGVESTAFALRAYLKIKPKSPYIPMMMKWLVRNRKGKRWFSTKSTAFVVYALAEYMKSTDELNPDMTVDVSYGKSFKRRFKVTRKNLILNKPEFTIPASIAKTGRQSMKIEIKGRGRIYYSSYLKYFTKEDPIKGAGHEIYVKRRYFKLTPKEVRRYRNEWDSQKRKYVRVAYKDMDYTRKAMKFGDRLRSGDLIEVALSIKANNNFEYLMFEDPKPAGCEPVALKSGSTYQGGFISNMELRDTLVSFFVTYLKQGKHEIRYKLRAEIPGIFNVMPSQSQAMYSPYVRGISDSWKMKINEALAR